ncbi:hypothetical protein FF36_04333 [Frankia torreyi]|uniref:Uncharacterized protein n=1 Tax=Frankia torreyi TaxID=1856 RepID=A0A0D8BDD2_9ACTN|nr:MULTISPECIES: hypothetical protein [Frankia]KJE21402.1 hypothetical protein FF36_04333 [Frankia torreyi]
MPLSDLPANHDVLTYLRDQAVRPRRESGRYVLDGWELHTHPDLVERFDLISPSRAAITPVFGVPVVVANGIAAAFATGTGWLLLRLPQPPTDVEMVEPIAALDGKGWHSVDAWQDVSKRSLGRLQSLTHAAMEYAAELAGDSPVQPSAPRE